MLYKAEKDHCQHYPKPVSADLFGGVSRNFQVFDPLDFLAELTQHIPNKGEHPIRYYGCYSNKSRGLTRKNAASQISNPKSSPATTPPIIQSPKLDRRRWAMLIQRIYNADPLLCPKCGGTMKVIAFIEARQADVIEKILRHCGLWHDPPARAPPTSGHVAAPQRDPGFTFEADGDYLEHARREQFDQPDLPWEP